MFLRSSLILLVYLSTASAQLQTGHWKNALTPPMGWNSWDCFGTTLTEADARQQADAMAKFLKPYGWVYFTVDIQWYEPNSQGHVYKSGAFLEMDEYSRLIPGLKKFPSASGGKGFKPLADYVHARGLKFGIHIMRGVPKQAVRQNTPILGTDARAADIANTRSFCPWNPDMWGVDMTKTGAQEYYDSLFKLYASWGVDFVKVDDISRPYDDNQKAEIEAIRKAIDKCKRPMVLSLSPGDTPIERGKHVMNHANMWRISDDFWDRWPPLYGMFGRLDKWTRYRTQGAWPDADMLPFGIIDFNRSTNFSQNEQILCMSLWCIARSPLILGGDMTRMDDFTIKLLTNPEVLAVNQKSINNRQISSQNDLIVWSAEIPGSNDRYVGLFNAQSNDDPFDLSKADYRRTLLGTQKIEAVDISLPINNARRLVLAVGDAGDGNSYDHAAWIEPVVTGQAGTLKLTDLNWIYATCGWGKIQKNHTVEGRSLMLDGKTVEGIGTHSISVIEFEIPEGYDTFMSKGMITDASRANGSIEFLVLVDPVSQIKPEYSRASVSFAQLGIKGRANVRDLWMQKDLGEFNGSFGSEIPLHGAGLFRISPVNSK